MNLIYNGLVKYDGGFNIVPDLAEKCEECGGTITFESPKRSQAARWKELTAYDVQYTFELLKSLKYSAANYKSIFQEAEARVIDDHLFQITYLRPFAPGLDPMDHAHLA